MVVWQNYLLGYIIPLILVLLNESPMLGLIFAIISPFYALLLSVVSLSHLHYHVEEAVAWNYYSYPNVQYTGYIVILLM